MKLVAGIFLGLVLTGACVRDNSSDATSGPVSSGATTGEPGSCDSGVMGELDLTVDPCKTCAKCATEAKCADEAVRCPSWNGGEGDPNVPCDAFRACYGDCFQQFDTNNNNLIDNAERADFNMCIGDLQNPSSSGCTGDHFDGSQDFLSLLSCIVCQECKLNCDEANNCM